MADGIGEQQGAGHQRHPDQHRDAVIASRARRASSPFKVASSTAHTPARPARAGRSRCFIASKTPSAVSSGSSPATQPSARNTNRSAYPPRPGHGDHHDRAAQLAHERWVGTVRRECLDQLLIVGRQQLVRFLRRCV